MVIDISGEIHVFTILAGVGRSVEECRMELKGTQVCQ